MFQPQNTSLNTMQQKAFNAMQMGKSILITGAGGVGKSHLVNVFQDWVREINTLKIGITSTTGVSALLINGTTIHSWAGIGFGNDTLVLVPCTSSVVLGIETLFVKYASLCSAHSAGSKIDAVKQVDVVGVH